MELSEKEAHCVARLLQGAIYGNGIWAGCGYCKFQCRNGKWRLPGFDDITERLTQETGVDLIRGCNMYNFENAHPHLRFLKNSNAETKRWVREQADEYAAALKAATAE